LFVRRRGARHSTVVPREFEHCLPKSGMTPREVMAPSSAGTFRVL